MSEPLPRGSTWEVARGGMSDGVTSVTDPSLRNMSQAGSRNSSQSRSASDVLGVTDHGPAAYAPGPASVTCRLCGRPIAATDAFVVVRYRWAVTGASSGDPVCCDCANVHRDVLPWVGSGVTGSREEYEHVCGNCDRFFYGAMQRRWCSEACGEAVRAQRRRRRRERAREARAVSPQPCIVCGEPFTLARSDARYCSNACRQDAYRKRKLGGATAR